MSRVDVVKRKTVTKITVTFKSEVQSREFVNALRIHGDLEAYGRTIDMADKRADMNEPYQGISRGTAYIKEGL